MSSEPRVLVIGATGQLGTQIVLRLLANGVPTRALVRSGSLHRLRGNASLSVAFGDLREPATLAAAMAGVDTVVSTANTIIPGRSDRFGEDELAGYDNLLRCAAAAGVRKLVYVSAFCVADAEPIPEFIVKRRIERLIQNSGLEHCILRCAAFMDSYFPVVGSALALRGSVNATLQRGHWLQRTNERWSGWPLDQQHRPVLPGDGSMRHPYIALDDVAEVAADAACNASLTGVVDLQGPQSLSWTDVARAHFGAMNARQARRSVRIPVAVFATAGWLLKPISPSAANLMAIMHFLSSHSMPANPAASPAALGVRPTTAHEFLAGKALIEPGLAA